MSDVTLFFGHAMSEKESKNEPSEDDTLIECPVCYEVTNKMVSMGSCSHEFCIEVSCIFSVSLAWFHLLTCVVYPKIHWFLFRR